MRYLKKFNEKFPIITENMDDYLDAINSGGHIYWDEKEKLFLGKAFDRVRHLDDNQKKLLEQFPDVILFKDGENVLIPYYINGDEMNGGSYTIDDENELVYRVWDSKNTLITYHKLIVEDFDGIIKEIGEQTQEDGRPMIDDEFDFDEIDESRIEKILSYLSGKSNRNISNWVSKYILDKRYLNKSRYDVAVYIVKNGLWDKVKDSLDRRMPEMVTSQKYQNKIDTHDTELFARDEYDFFVKLIRENEVWINDSDLGIDGKRDYVYLRLYPNIEINITKLKDNWYLIDESDSESDSDKFFICDEWNEVLGYLDSKPLKF